MPSVVIKPVRDRDEYVIWSTVTESPHAFGGFEKMTALLVGGIRGGGFERSQPVLARADQYGTSDFAGWGGWGTDAFIYHQAGLLPRARMYEAACLMDGFMGGGCQEVDVLNLLDPLWDDEGGVRLEWRKRHSGDVAVSLEGERRTAGLATEQIAATVRGWNR